MLKWWYLPQVVELVNCSMWARSLTPKHFIIELLDVFDKIEHPFVVHCKSGADRASLAAAFYLIYKKGYTVEQTRNQFGLKYLHLKFSRTDMVLLDLSCDKRVALDDNLIMIKRLARVENVKEAKSAPKGSVTLTIDGGTICLPLS